MSSASVAQPIVYPTGLARAIIVITTITAAIMELVDTSIVNVALNDMSGSLGVSIEDISWVITSYAIANVIIIPLTSFLAEYFGRKNYYIVSMIIFTIASYMCGQSHSLIEIIIWRFVQGIGGGALLSTSQAILFDAFEPKDRPKASGLFGMGIVLGPTLGPTLGGYIIDHASWPLIFMINIPIGIIATVLSFTFINKKPNEGKKKDSIKIDYTGKTASGKPSGNAEQKSGLHDHFYFCGRFWALHFCVCISCFSTKGIRLHCLRNRPYSSCTYTLLCISNACYWHRYEQGLIANPIDNYWLYPLFCLQYDECECKLGCR